MSGGQRKSLTDGLLAASTTVASGVAGLPTPLATTAEEAIGKTDPLEFEVTAHCSTLVHFSPRHMDERLHTAHTERTCVSQCVTTTTEVIVEFVAVHQHASSEVDSEELDEALLLTRREAIA